MDDHPLFRQGLLNLLEKEKKLKVVGEANDGKIAIDMVRKLSPDIVVMDISMPKIDGIEATRQILSEFPDTKVVALSVHSEKQFVRGMLEAGAIGYILKESASKEIVEGLGTVLAGNVYLSRSISGIVVSDYSRLLSEAGDITESASEPILRTKLHRPPVTADIIPRARLVKQLEEGRTRAMTLISAPAGYGKTILASQWLEACQYPSAWVSLDQSDDDLHEFLTYFMAAVQSAFPTLILQTQSLLQAADMPPVKVLVRYMLNDLDQVKKPFILVLDDYHHIQKEAINDLLAELLRHPSPMLHLVLLTRRDPPLPFSNLRTYNQLTEIGIRDLRFTVEETTSFLERLLRVPIDEDTVSVLEDKVEGWVT
ncbi:MAG: response regulator, partial [Desulfobacteraceae bacterium]|nr:response regulator [Desulfobacteraceae bacterium]